MDADEQHETHEKAGDGVYEGIISKQTQDHPLRNGGQQTDAQNEQGPCYKLDQRYAILVLIARHFRSTNPRTCM